MWSCYGSNVMNYLAFFCTVAAFPNILSNTFQSQLFLYGHHPPVLKMHATLLYTSNPWIFNSCGFIIAVNRTLKMKQRAVNTIQAMNVTIIITFTRTITVRITWQVRWQYRSGSRDKYDGDNNNNDLVKISRTDVCYNFACVCFLNCMISYGVSSLLTFGIKWL